MRMARARRRPGAPGSRSGRRRRRWDRGRGAAAPAWRARAPAARAWRPSPPPLRASAARADRAASSRHVASVRSSANTPTAVAHAAGWCRCGRGELRQLAVARPPPRRGERDGRAPGPPARPRRHQRRTIRAARYAPTAMPSRTGRKRLRRSAKWMAATGTSTRRHPCAAAPTSISDSRTKPPRRGLHGRRRGRRDRRGIPTACRRWRCR